MQSVRIAIAMYVAEVLLLLEWTSRAKSVSVVLFVPYASAESFLLLHSGLGWAEG